LAVLLVAPSPVRAAGAAAPSAPSPARSSPCAAKPPEPMPAPGSPAAALKAFDSLLDAGRLPEARALCVGPMLRMFDFVALAHSKVAGLVDPCRSRETILEEKAGGGWAYVKSSGITVFRHPFMGQDSLASVQAAHLYRSGQGWRLSEIEELPDSAAPVHLRTGTPEGNASGGEGRAAGLFPVSRLAPSEAGLADRLRLRLTLRNGENWEGLLPLGPGQKRLRALSPSSWLVENRRVLPGPPGAAPPSPQDARWLASNAYLVLGDTLLKATADSIAGKETDPERIAAAAYKWVSDRFHFRLGAALFGASPEVLRGLTGDCSEAAVLTAALLRARGVPARVALGFASVGRGVFIGHAWCEARLGGEWVGVDAALREFPAGVERVKLAELDGHEDMRIAATNLMMRVIANLDIQIEGAWKGQRALPLKEYAGNAGEAEKYFDDILKGAGGSP